MRLPHILKLNREFPLLLERVRVRRLKLIFTPHPNLLPQGRRY